MLGHLYRQEGHITLHLLFFEVYQLFVVFEDAYISEGSPSLLDLLCREILLCLLWYLLLAREETTPSPLDLDSSDMIHCEAMVLEKTSCQSHLISCLNERSAEVSPALLLTLVKNVEW